MDTIALTGIDLFVGLRSKMYSYLTESNNRKTGKGIKKYLIKKKKQSQQLHGHIDEQQTNAT